MPDSLGQEERAEGVTATAMPAETKPTVTSQTPPEVPASTEGELPADASERTRQEFEKLKAKNKELAEQLRLKEQQSRPASVMEELFSPPPVQQVQEAPATLPVELTQQVEEVKQSLVDKEGYLDTQFLERTLKDSDSRQKVALEAAKRAEERAKAAEEKIARFEQTQVTQKLHESFPQADPYSDKFDPAFYNHLKKELVFQMTQGRTDPIEAAKQVMAYYKPPQAEAPQNDALAQRQQATAQAGGKRSPTPKLSEDDLVKGTRQGDLSAFNERLRRAGY